MSNFVDFVLNKVRDSRRKPPSLRNEQVYQAVRIDCRRQADVAAEFKISPRRVSQIVRRVEDWLQTPNKSLEAPYMTYKQACDVADMHDIGRLEALYTRAVRAFDDATEGRVKTKSVRTRQTENGEQADTTVREIAPNIQALKVAQRSLEMMWRLVGRGPFAPKLDPTLQDPKPADEMKKAIDALVRLRCQAEAGGHAPHSQSPTDLVHRLVLKLAEGSPDELRKLAPWEDECPPADPPKEATGSTGVEPPQPEVAVAEVVVSASGDAGWGEQPTEEPGQQPAAKKHTEAVFSPIFPETASSHGQDARGTREEEPAQLPVAKNLAEPIFSPMVPETASSHGQDARGTPEEEPAQTPAVENSRQRTICPDCAKFDPPEEESEASDRRLPRMEMRAYVVCKGCEKRRAKAAVEAKRPKQVGPRLLDYQLVPCHYESFG
jgi:hypothetical protein